MCIQIDHHMDTRALQNSTVHHHHHYYYHYYYHIGNCSRYCPKLMTSDAICGSTLDRSYSSKSNEHIYDRLKASHDSKRKFISSPEGSKHGNCTPIAFLLHVTRTKNGHAHAVSTPRSRDGGINAIGYLGSRDVFYCHKNFLFGTNKSKSLPVLCHQ